MNLPLTKNTNTIKQNKTNLWRSISIMHCIRSYIQKNHHDPNSILLLIHWSRWRIKASVCWVIIGAGNDLSHIWSQAIIWTNNGFMSMWPSGTIFSKISINKRRFLFVKMALKMSAKLPFCLGLNVKICIITSTGLLGVPDIVIKHEWNKLQDIS